MILIYPENYYNVFNFFFLAPTPVTNETSDYYYEESTHNDKSNTMSQWLDEFMEETGIKYAGVYISLRNLSVT